MKTFCMRGALALPLALCAQSALAADSSDDGAPLTDTIVVVGQRIDALADQADPVSAHATAPDAAALAARLPGAALINNGAISGQVQYRGLFGDRLSVRVGGQDFQTGGPNAMDPPLHYAPAILLDRIVMSRGAAPVSEGPGLGGLVEARLKTIGFGTGDAMAPSASLAASWRSADRGLAVGGVAGLASTRWRINAIAAWEQGDDYRIPDGRVRDTAYERLTYGLSAGFQAGGNRLSLDWRRQETGKSGNPPYAMDIDYFHTDFLRAGFDGEIAGRKVALAMGMVQVRHGMENFQSRPAPASPAQYRYSYAEAQTFTASARIGFGALTLGADMRSVDRLVTITNPRNPAFFVGSLDRVAESRVGGLGVRVDRTRSRMADPRTGTGVPPMVAMLARAVSASNAQRGETTWDAVARIWRESGAIRPRLTLAHKMRAPNAVERFGWLPTEASGGLADGNIYIGRQSLRPEQAWSAEAGADFGNQALSFRPSAYYRRVDDYIQGAPVPATMPQQLMIAAMNGDPTPLIFTNVDAELYGLDADFGWQAMERLRFEATISWVRGKRRDIADNLYRIAPLNGRASLAWAGDAWQIAGELVGAAAQRKVSRTNGESGSPGWVAANLWFDATIAGRITLAGGIENLFDRRYAQHLAGRNRIPGSDIAVGERLPAPGRSLFVRIGYAF